MPNEFWADDFDMDLLKIFPHLPQMLGDTGEVKLWTVGSERDGKLVHPTVWNSHGAYVWTEKPNLPRDKHGWFRVDGCVDDSPEIEVTWGELLRDQWAHSYAFILKPLGALFDGPPEGVFMDIMYDLRGWNKCKNIERAKAIAQMWLMQSNAHMEQALAHLSAEERIGPCRKR